MGWVSKMCNKINSSLKMWSSTHNKSRTLEFHSQSNNESQSFLNSPYKVKEEKVCPNLF